ncbi:hypothetical protein [Streptosporangium carneum]|uniref:Uncharacterized protein n=1 Tax=Streptosporangium carneum TaxID=47481 RepID=A0A9W6MCY8_9ACTN|nr:hypothetical protein [Streptosporangium carneum]GLK09522.1 hypothetical protein GCM10017600_29280 [Streptosporangium carneum]
MGVFDFLRARRLRRGPTLLLPSSATPWKVLETVRQHSPEATAQDRRIMIGKQLRLSGPFTVTRKSALLAGIPVGWPVAYVVELLTPDSDINPAAITAGLAQRLGGLCCPHTQDRSPDLFAITGRALPVGRLSELLPGSRPRAIAGVDITLLANGWSPLEITFCGGEDGEMDYEVSVGRGPVTPALVEAAERLAMSIGEASHGVVRDHNGFLLRPSATGRLPHGTATPDSRQTPPPLTPQTPLPLAPLPLTQNTVIPDSGLTYPPRTPQDMVTRTPA